MKSPAEILTSKNVGILEIIERFQQTMMLSAQDKQAKAAARIITRFVWHEHVSSPEQITAAKVEAYLGRLARVGRALKTLHNHRSAISSFCRFCIRQGLLEQNPCKQVQLRKVPERPARYLTDEEIKRVLELARAHDIFPEVALALGTGLRLGELIRLKWFDVDFQRRSLIIRKSKSGRVRVVPLSEMALAALSEQWDKTGSLTYVFAARYFRWRHQYFDRPRSPSWFRRAIRPIQAQIPKFRMTRGTGRGWHLLRHTFASRAAQRGVSIYKLASWLGHTDVKTTRIYAHLQGGYDKDIEQVLDDVIETSHRKEVRDDRV